MITFERKHIGWGLTENEPLEMVVRFRVPTDFENCHYHVELHRIERRMHAAGYDTDIGYSDGVVVVTKRTI